MTPMARTHVRRRRSCSARSARRWRSCGVAGRALAHAVRRASDAAVRHDVRGPARRHPLGDRHAVAPGRDPRQVVDDRAPRRTRSTPVRWSPVSAAVPAVAEAAARRLGLTTTTSLRVPSRGHYMLWLLSTMRCPWCDADEDRVVDSRPADGGAAIRRRRECAACGRRYTTFERIEDVGLVVVKRDGTKEPFDRAEARRRHPQGRRRTGRSRRARSRTSSTASRAASAARARGHLAAGRARGAGRRSAKLDEVAYLRFAQRLQGLPGDRGLRARARCSAAEEGARQAPTRGRAAADHYIVVVDVNPHII